MEATYQSFLDAGLDLAALGAERRGESISYFCTPEGAEVFGWAGVDGIHFCFVPGFGEMVFAVSPMNGGADCVHPLARSFADFLRLLLACGDTAALEQAWQWDLQPFQAYCAELTPDALQRQTLEQIRKTFGLSPMERPWHYIRELQAEFDFASIPYSREYYDLVGEPQKDAPQWAVYFDGGFYGRPHQGQRPGEELPLGNVFAWADHTWVVPAAYVCEEGLVVDYAMEVDPGDILRFTQKWGLTPENEGQLELTAREEHFLRLDNPLDLRFRTELLVNGALLRPSHSCSVVHNPCFLRWSEETQAVLEHYGLDEAVGWVLWRSCYPWSGDIPWQIKTLTVNLHGQPVSVPGPEFQVEKPGDTVQFRYPPQGETYTLTVEEYEAQEAKLPRPGPLEYPGHYMALSYTVSPELPQGLLMVQDWTPSDPVRVGGGYGIIGGADGPTAIFVGSKPKPGFQVACSAVHFEPPKQVNWQMVFHETRYLSQSVRLL